MVSPDKNIVSALRISMDIDLKEGVSMGELKNIIADHVNLLIGAYFSKPDWHTDNYWWPYFPPKDRNVNYEVKKYPERWKASNISLVILLLGLVEKGVLLLVIL